MNRSRTIVLLTVLMIAGAWAFREWQIQAHAIKAFAPGPDVIVGDIPSTRRWGTVGTETSYSIGTTSCNIGTTRLNWIQSTNVHPVISQNLFRIKNGRIEHLGMSWLKHGFSVAAGSLCNSCTDPASNYLGVGCSDPYGSSLNGTQSGLGPKSQVNALTGIFTMPYGRLPQTGTLDGRIRVQKADLNPAQNPGARFFVESQYVHPEDAASGNALNNASYREVFVVANGSEWDLNMGTPQTVRQQAAINAWKAVHPDVQLFNVDIPGDGRVIVGVRSIPTGGGNWHHEIAIENLNSHQSVRSLIGRFGGNTVTNPGFRDVTYQFEPYSSTDWTPVASESQIEWSTETFAANANANAIRWNTVYSYWCDSNGPLRTLKLGLFRPGLVSQMTVDVVPVTLPQGRKLLDGNQTGGQTSDLYASDDSYFTVDPPPTTNLRKQRVDLILNATSLVANPTDFGFRLEASMTGGPTGSVTQGIDLLNQSTGLWETVNTRMASSSDTTVDVAPVGDLRRFIHPQTSEISARVYWKSETFSGAPFEWLLKIDEAVWLIK
jgi:hypothetical protein